MGPLDQLRIDEQLLDLQLEEAELDKQLLTAEFEGGLAKDFPGPAEPGFQTAEPSSTAVAPQLPTEISPDVAKISAPPDDPTSIYHQKGQEFEQWKQRQPLGYGGPETMAEQEVMMELAEQPPIKVERKPIEDFPDFTTEGGRSAYQFQEEDYQRRLREVTGERSFIGKTVGEVMNMFRSGAQLITTGWDPETPTKYAQIGKRVLESKQELMDVAKDERPEIMEGLKALGTELKEHPVKTLRTFGTKMFEEMPSFLLLRKITPNWINSMKNVKNSTQARKLLVKAGFKERAAGELMRDLPAGQAQEYLSEKGRGSDYTPGEAALAAGADVLFAGIGSGWGSFRDVKVRKIKGLEHLEGMKKITTKEFDTIEKLTITDNMEKNPNLAEMIPVMQELTKSPEVKQIISFKPDGENKFYTREMLDEIGYKDREPDWYTVGGKTKDGKIELTNEATPSTIVEEYTHYLQDVVRKKHPEIQQRLNLWEAEIKAEAKEAGVKLPEDDELFAQAFTSHMGYAKEYPGELQSIVIPDELLDDFRGLMGEKIEKPTFMQKATPVAEPPETLKDASPESKVVTAEKVKIEEPPPETPRDHDAEIDVLKGKIKQTKKMKEKKALSREIKLIKKEKRKSASTVLNEIDKRIEGIESRKNKTGLLSMLETLKKEIDDPVQKSKIEIDGLKSRYSKMKKLLQKQKDIGKKPLYQLKKQAKTPEFKKWFGKSKIKDDNGDPKIVYHGTVADFSEFKEGDIGFHFGTIKQASSRMKEIDFEGENIVPAYLSIKKPYDMVSDIGIWDDMPTLKEYLTEANEGPFSSKEFSAFKNVGDVREGMIKKGYDGIIYENRFEAPEEKANSYIAFKPSQIKSATGNLGKFDPKKADVRYQLKPKVKPESLPKLYKEHGESDIKPSKPVKTLEAIGKGLEKALVPISTRLRKINPKLKDRVRRHVFDTMHISNVFRRQSRPFLDKMKKMNKADRKMLDLSLKNGDPAVTDKIVKAYGIEKEYRNIQSMLKKTWLMAKNSGYDIGYVENYFPRVIRDKDGLLSHIRGSKNWSILKDAIDQKQKKLDRPLTDTEVVEIVDQVLKGYTPGISKVPSNVKQRKIKELTSELDQYYYSSEEAILKYIDQMTEGTTVRKFFGKHLQSDEDGKIDAQASIGAYTADLMLNDKITPKQEVELREMLSALFKPGVTGPVISAFRNLEYIDTMGSISSAMTQIQDLAFGMHNAGVFNALKHYFTKKNIKMEDINLEKVAQEFAEPSKSAKVVEAVFKSTGLTFMDKLGKETLINASMSKMTKQAKKGDANLRKKLEPIFEGETDQVIKDLKAGKVTDNVKYLLFNEVADLQPIALSEMPENYLKSGNLKILYMLKSFTIRQVDVFRKALIEDIKAAKGKKETALAVGRMARLAGSFVAMGMAADSVKDFVFGRDFDLEDTFIDNMWKMMGLSKYQAWVFREEGAWEVAQKMVAPPFKILEGVTRDYNKWAKDDLSLGTSESVGSIPHVGKLYYWWYGSGSQKVKKRRIKKIWENLTEMRSITRKYDKIKKDDFEKGKEFLKENKKEIGMVKVGTSLKSKWNKLQKLIESTDEEKKITALKEKQERLIAKFEKYVESLK